MAPKHVGALRVRGHIHAARKDHQKALDDFNAALALLPADITSQVGRGQALEALGRSEEAIVALAKPKDAPASCPKGTTCL